MGLIIGILRYVSKINLQVFNMVEQMLKRSSLPLRVNGQPKAQVSLTHRISCRHRVAALQCKQRMCYISHLKTFSLRAFLVRNYKKSVPEKLFKVHIEGLYAVVCITGDMKAIRDLKVFVVPSPPPP